MASAAKTRSGRAVTRHCLSLAALATASLAIAGCGGSSAFVPVVHKSTPLIAWSNPAPIVYGTALTSSELNATANVPGSFVYSPAPGSVPSAGTKILSATFTPSDTSAYDVAAATVSLTVQRAPTALTWSSPPPLPYNSPLGGQQLNAIANVPGTFAYTPAPGATLPVGTQTLSVAFSPADAVDYLPSTATVPLTIVQATPVISWPTPAAISYGTALGVAQLDATASVPGAFAYTPPLGTALSAGQQTLGVTFMPADSTSYTRAAAIVPLTVRQGIPVLAWSAPAAVSYGTTLSALQLNATASLPGSFSYNPPLGTLLEAGSHTLSATFTPADAANYAAVATSATLLVDPVTPVLTWPAPAPIPLGTALSAAQLNAVATAPGSSTVLDGTYLYTPAAGTRILSAGPQTVQVTFTPSDGLNYNLATSTNSVNITPFGVVAWGDSLTNRYNHEDYPTDLQKLIYLPVLNEGVPGQTSTQIGVREGGIPTQVQIAGGVIPASGGVQVSFTPGREPVTDYNQPNGVSGTILGVHGTVVETVPASPAQPYSTFTRTTPGDPVPANGSPQLIVDTPYLNFLPIFWEGRNNFWNKDQVLSDIAAQVATVPPGQDYLVMGVTNGNTETEWKGGSNYAVFLDINNNLSNKYGSHYLDIRKVLVDSYDPTLATDVAYHNLDVPSTSLRGWGANGVLAQSIGPNDTSLTVNLTANGLYPGWILTIDSGAQIEDVYITSVSGNTATVKRGYGGPPDVALSHSAGARVLEVDTIHFNAKGHQITANAVARYLSAYANSAK